jgi:hypothetical protein
LLKIGFLITQSSLGPLQTFICIGPATKKSSVVLNCCVATVITTKKTQRTLPNRSQSFTHPHICIEFLIKGNTGLDAKGAVGKISDEAIAFNNFATWLVGGRWGLTIITNHSGCHHPPEGIRAVVQHVNSKYGSMAFEKTTVA